jgi:hypothetical protein
MSYQDLPIRSDTYSDYSYQPLLQAQPTGGGSVADFALRQSVAAIEKLRNLPDNWDGRGSVKPSDEDVDAARQWLSLLHLSLSKIGAKWLRPHVAASEDGSAVLEWWHTQKKLTLYLNRNGAEFIKVWGPHIQNDMTDGELTPSEFPAIWTWLSE